MLQHKDDLGYGLLVKKYASDLNQATPEMIRQAAHDTVPKVTPLFYGFRIMVGLGFTFIAMFIYAFWASANNVIHEKKAFCALLCGCCRRHGWRRAWAGLWLNMAVSRGR